VGRVNFQLGHGSKTQSAEEAIQKFLRREFPQLFEGSHEAIFIPESFQYFKYADKVKCCKIVLHSYVCTCKSVSILGSRFEKTSHRGVRTFINM
jgi:hypothetical protein